MDKSFVLIALSLGTLLIGLAVAIYQLWSANKAQQQGEYSALAKRFGGKVLNRFQPIDGLPPGPRLGAADRAAR